jgi:hypothetical protein
MKRFIIERTIPGAGKLSAADLKSIAKTSCETVETLETPYYWIETFVTDDKMYCVHVAEDEQQIRDHAKKAGFPVDSVSEVQRTINPSWGA